MRTDLKTAKLPRARRAWTLVVAGIGVAFAVITGIVALRNSFTEITDWAAEYSPAVSRYADAAAIRDLHPGVDIASFESRLGKATYKTSAGPYVEHVFVRDNCYVQAIADGNAQVLFFAVTVKNAEFRPAFQTPGMDNGFTQPVTLGVTRFSEWGAPDQLHGWFGASWMLYAESVSLPHSDNFVGVVMASNDAGHYFETEGAAPFVGSDYPDPLNDAVQTSDLDSPAIRWYREGTIANTYGEFVGEFSVSDLFDNEGVLKYDIFIGPNSVKVGAVDPR